jgi:hypothetical protein
VVAGAAATGAEIGASVATISGPFYPIAGPIASAAGAVIGAGIAAIEEAWPLFEKDGFNPIDIVGDLAGDVLNVVGLDEPNPPQIDFRYSSEKVCFPAINPDAPYGVIPGQYAMNPRCYADSDFFELPSGHNQAHSMLFTFLVGYRQAPGTTLARQKKAWVLAQFFTATDKVTTQDQSDVLDAGTYWDALLKLMSVKDATSALLLTERWYGQRKGFSTSRPYAPNCAPPKNDNRPSTVAAMMREYAAKPLDFLYYPIPSYYDKGTLEFGPTSPAKATDCMLVPDTSLLMVCEYAVKQCADRTINDLEVFHAFVQLAHFWKQGRQLDAKKYKGLSTANHPNFSRCIGLIAYQMRRTAAANAAKKTAARRASSPQSSIARAVVPSAPSAPRPQAPAVASSAPVVVVQPRSMLREIVEGVAVAAVVGGLVAFFKRKG